MAIIAVSGLKRDFKTRTGTVEAVKGVDFEVRDGEIVGFLGPNGAGKTTTLRMLTTLLRPTAGSATVAGADLLGDPREVRRRIGYVAQGGGADDNSAVLEELVLQARLYGLSPAEAAERAALLIGQLDLSGLEKRFSKTLSGGQRRRLDIALGLVHGPKLVFLDEPSTGLDPQSRSNLWDHVRRLRDDLDTTVFLTTHYLDEADALCDRILVIDNGRIVAEGSPDALKRRISGDVLTIGVGDAVEKAKALLSDREEVREVSVFDSSLHLTVENGEQSVVELMRVLEGGGVPVEFIQLARPTLDDVFLTLTGRSLRDDVTA